MTSVAQLTHEWYLAMALYDAIDDGNLREVTALIQKKQSNPNIVIPEYGITPFHLAVGHENIDFAKDVTKLFLKNGGNPNVIGVDGVTPLHVAVAWNRSVIVRLLLTYGADPWIKDDSERNSFDYAYEENAMEALKTLEVYKRTRHTKCDEEGKNYKIHLDKVIIHSKDVQAEFKAFCDSCLKDIPLSKQSVATQTPFPFGHTKIAEKIDDSEYEEFESANSVTSHRMFDSCYDWCNKTNDVVIPDECKRKIVKHRSKTSTYEYRPELSTVVCSTRNENKNRYFPPVCCANTSGEWEENGTPNFYFKNNSENCENTKEKLFTKDANNVINVFSENSIISEERSLYSKPFKEISLLEPAEDIPFIDDSVSGSFSNINVSQKQEEKLEDDGNINANNEKSSETALQPLHKENIKHVLWSGCLSECACIRKHQDDDSFTMYSTVYDKNEQKLPNSVSSKSMVSGINVLPDSVLDLSKSAAEDSKLQIELKSNGDILPQDSKNISVEFKYTDDEDGIEFIAAKMPLSNSANKENRKSPIEDSEISDSGAYDTDYIRRELKKLGFVSGPMSGTVTKKLYLRKLRRIKKNLSNPVMNFIKPQFSAELEQVLRADNNWVETLSKWSYLEKELRENFLDTSLSSTWRTGTAKTSFTYLLLDPRISKNLPARCEDMNLIDVWRIFVRSIFYIGKGTRARPYEHLHEAFSIWRETQAHPRRHCNLKVSYILEIWKEGLGVVCLQAFHNLIPAEAYTREAAMIDAIGLAQLKNEKCGMYYGVASSWNMKVKRRLGTFLLYRAMRMFIADNEIQLKPTDVN